MLHSGAAGEEKQLAGTDANKGSNRYLSIRLHQYAPGTDIPRECLYGTKLISILPHQNDPSPKGQTLMCAKVW